MSATPISLLARLRDPGAEDAWARFVHLYTPLLFRWARGTGLQESDAADLVQDVFALLVRKLPQFTYDRNKGFRAWLRTVTLNRWREIRRRAAPPALAEGLDQLPDPDDEPFGEADYRSHLALRLLEIMKAEFAPTTWKACWECTLEGRSAVEVGRELGLRAGAVRAANFRVLSRLRREMDGGHRREDRRVEESVAEVQDRAGRRRHRAEGEMMGGVGRGSPVSTPNGVGEALETSARSW